MDRIFLNLLSCTLVLMLSCRTLSAQEADFRAVIPAPLQIETARGGDFSLSPDVKIVAEGAKDQLRAEAEFLQQYILERTGWQLTIAKKKKSADRCIVLRIADETGNFGEKAHADEGYVLTVSEQEIVIAGRSAAGVFYGIQVLRKALPSLRDENVAQTPMKPAKISVPAVRIQDAPRFAYRGAHLDVARHFFTTDSICRFIDMCALHQINRFHWHLTDDQGWRIEIKHYPLLTQVGSKRAQTVIGHNSGQYDGKPYGGFYTQQEIKDIIAYAAARHITIIPEIDLPGHMQAALSAYPDLGCTGGPYKVWEIWGVSDDVLCAGNDHTYTFIRDVLTEVCALFPSEYIHVGGDECPKTRWKACPKCQQRIDSENLRTGEGNHTPEERLQSHVIKYAEGVLSELGRKMIGWDETLEGGLAEGATVMSWRGEGGGIEAARQGHDVVMTPNTYLYFDYYQSADVENEPDAIGGFLPLEHVYRYEPMPRRLSPDKQKHIIGVQANLWTEYIPTFRGVEYMELPRMAALCEVQWSQPEKKNYPDFCRRLTQLMKIYDEIGLFYGQHAFDITADFHIAADQGAVVMELRSADPEADLRYTLDGTEPTEESARYAEPVLIRQSANVRARRIDGAAPARETVSEQDGRFTIVKRARGLGIKGFGEGVKEVLSFNRATARPIRLLTPPHGAYTFAGADALVDGLCGTNTNYKTGRWIGFVGSDAEAVIDLGEGGERPTKVVLHTCVEKGDWIFDARAIRIYLSEDGETFRLVGEEEYPAMAETDRNGIYTHEVAIRCCKGDVENCPAATGENPDETGKKCPSARFLKVVVETEKHMPSWHGGAGSPAFVFIDEIEVY